MLGSISQKYLKKSQEMDVQDRPKNLGFGFSFGVPVESLEDMNALREEEKFYTAQDLGYE